MRAGNFPPPPDYISSTTTTRPTRGSKRITSIRMRAAKEFTMTRTWSNYQMFLFDLEQAQRMGLDHWDSLWHGLAWVGRR